MPAASTDNQSGVLIFVHVPKAAGSTLRRIMDRQYGEHGVHRCDMQLYPEALTELQRLPADRLEQIRCVIGHLPYGIHEYLPGPARYVTILRNPVDRFLSKYSYLRNNDWVAEQLRVRKKEIASLDAFVDMQLERNAMNFQTRQISGCVDLIVPMPPFPEPVSADTLAKARENLQNDFVITGLQERFNESLLLMKQAFGWSDVYYSKQNVTSRPAPRSDIPARTRSLIERYNELDMQLFEFARERFAEQALAYGPRLGKDLQIFEKKNKKYTGRKGTLAKAKYLVWRARNLLTPKERSG